MPIVVLGSDALLAASPATPVQLAHACMRAGFTNVIPASWGDELIAAAVLRRLPEFGAGPAIQCSCPIVAHRLLTVGGDLRPALVALAPPPVAIARYIKAVSHPARTRITYVGACPGAIDESIDIRMTPEALIAMLSERQIILDEQPRVFDSIIPPDRRRFLSQPGGLPTAEALWDELGSRALVELEGDELVSDLAQQLLSGKNVLIDVATRLGCVCSGAVDDTPPKDARARVVALEPPRSSTPVIEELDTIDLDMPLPAVPRTPVDVLAVPHTPTPHRGVAVAPPVASTPVGARVSPGRGLLSFTEPRQVRVSNPANARPVLGSLPVTRDVEGKSLPRAYVARRRSSPKGLPIVGAAHEEPVGPTHHRRAPSAVLTPPSDLPAIPESPLPPASVQRTVMATETSLVAEPAKRVTPAHRTPATPPSGSPLPTNRAPIAQALATSPSGSAPTVPPPSVPRSQPAVRATPAVAAPAIPPVIPPAIPSLRPPVPPASRVEPQPAAPARTTPPRPSQAVRSAALSAPPEPSAAAPISAAPISAEPIAASPVAPAPPAPPTVPATPLIAEPPPAAQAPVAPIATPTPTPTPAPSTLSAAASAQSAIPDARTIVATPASSRKATPPTPILLTRTSPAFTSRQAVFGLIAVLVIALSVGAVVAVLVARSLREPPAPAPSGVRR